MEVSAFLISDIPPVIDPLDIKENEDALYLAFVSWKHS